MSFDPAMMKSVNPIWPAERIERLRDLAAEGLSSAAIGRRLGTSGNSIIGKCHRLDIRLLCPNNMEKRGAVKAEKPQPVKAKKPKLEAPKPPETPIPWLLPRYGAGSTCQWPIGQTGTREFRFCEKPAAPNRPYCAECSRLAYQRKPNWTADAAA